MNKMGGVRAMREREKVGTQRWGWGWDEGNKEDGAGDGSQGEKGKESGEDGEDGAGFRANIRDEVGEEVDEREEGAPKQSDEIGDEEGYTMDLMLRSLNIDLDVIGYERKLQRWVD